jgi:hypothetical protein
VAVTNNAGINTPFTISLANGNQRLLVKLPQPLRPGVTYTNTLLPGLTDTSSNRWHQAASGAVPAEGVAFTFTTADILAVTPTNDTPALLGRTIVSSVNYESGLGARFFRFLVNGEPTDNRLGIATRGMLRVRLMATGRAAHSSFPELGESAIDKLLDALMVVRGLELPDDPELGRTHYTVGLIDGGVAPNVVSPHASAELMFRIVGDGALIYEALRVIEGLVALEHILEIPAVHMHRVSGFETAVFPYTTDVPVLTRWGRPLLIGPGSIHTAHTDHEHVSIDELRQAVSLYEALAVRLLTTGE